MILDFDSTPTFLPTRKETSKVLDTLYNLDSEDVFFILFRKENGQLTQRVAARLYYHSGNETVRFHSCMDGTEGEYRTAKLGNIFSLTKISKNQVAKLEFAGKL